MTDTTRTISLLTILALWVLEDRGQIPRVALTIAVFGLVFAGVLLIAVKNKWWQ